MAKKKQFSHEEDRIHPDALVRITQREARENGEHLKDIPVNEKNYRKFLGERPRKPLPKGLAWGIAGLVVLFVAGFGASYFIVRGRVVRSISTTIGTLQQGVQDLQAMDPASAAQAFSSVSTANGSLGSLSQALGFLFQGESNAISALSDISVQLTQLSQQLGSLENSGFAFLSTGQGGNFISDLNNIKGSIAAIDRDSNTLNDASSYFGGLSPVAGGAYVPLKAQAEGAENFLAAFIPWLSGADPHHVLLLFQNTSEMRPGGGFLGSYADVTIAGGTITGVAVHDVADADAAFPPKIVPPKQLQFEVTKLRPADGNWFFDFPTTASQTIALFESSTIYSAPKIIVNGKSTTTAPITFDGAIALTPAVISDLLTVTGPVSIPSGKSSTTFTADNLVVQIQKIVQAGQATAATYPKAVLGDLAQAIFTKIASSTDDQKQHLLALALNWMSNKDVMVYFKDPALESFVDSSGASGAQFELPQNFNGDYLAIANTDINSDKSEQYVSQDVDLNAVINDDGTETNHLTITRTHTGNKSPYWWYQTANLDYLQIFAPSGSTLDNETGGMAKTIPVTVNYIKDGYTTDPLIFTIESSTRTFFNYPSISYYPLPDKEVFTTWALVKGGASKTITLDYTHRLFGDPVDGEKYQFVFDKQPGASGHYHFEVNAPLGYQFAETGLPAFDYDATDTPGQLVVNLTLQKITD